MVPEKSLTIVGGGLAGSEAAWQAANRGVPVRLFEMKPCRFSPAHESPDLAELVCSNSLRSNELTSAVGLLKEEMRRLGSLIMAVAEQTQVPAGKSLAVDRHRFSSEVTKSIQSHPNVTLIREEVGDLDVEAPSIIATGPLSSAAMTQLLGRLTDSGDLYFYDAIAPIVYAESIDKRIAFMASRYQDGEGDYLNCPFDEEQYQVFYEALMKAEQTPLRAFEEPQFFEGCLPIEVLASRGDKTLLFGPMKPVGLKDPATGKRPFAVVQLRKENLEGTLYNMVGFQTRLRRPAQERVFRMIPALADARFARFGSVHRNTFVNGPKWLKPTLQLKNHPNILLAGQITGVEGYVESTAMGLLAGINGARLLQGLPLVVPPPESALGALVCHISASVSKNFQPMNVNFGLFPPPAKRIPKKHRRDAYVDRALQELTAWTQQL
ncbi:MAG: methylenetetrahydrofolate--tRNA-(uracil(54)-C(5))-methyltransferase (FADH(2)-oxidizing) TrmFO [Deltaproteobacteria bacterium]|nr:methylenetetrahydrofolate--tRNA-(uracil(54)-C(5))-methyltransferase (FADH(2)-oxidizing) TrmFO [Deltaproteobacteria bacterium]